MTQLIPAWVNGTLSPVDKLEVHRRGLKHPAISVFVMDRTKTLLQRRALGKYHTPGLWANACCTHPHWDESQAACAERRLSEELGITGLALEHRGQAEYRAAVGGGLTEHELVSLYVTEGGTSRIVPNSEEVMDVRWVEVADLRTEIAAAPDRFTPWLRIYMEKFSDLIFTSPV